MKLNMGGGFMRRHEERRAQQCHAVVCRGFEGTLAVFLGLNKGSFAPVVAGQRVGFKEVLAAAISPSDNLSRRQDLVLGG